MIKLILKNEIGDNTMFCPMCNKNVNYKIITEIIDEYRGYKVNVKQNIAVCDNCSERIYVSELENENLKSLYQKYRDSHQYCHPMLQYISLFVVWIKQVSLSWSVFFLY